MARGGGKAGGLIAFAIYHSLPDSPGPYTLWALDCQPGGGVPREIGEATFRPTLEKAVAEIPSDMTFHPPDPKQDGPLLIGVWYKDPPALPAVGAEPGS